MCTVLAPDLASHEPGRLCDGPCIHPEQIYNPHPKKFTQVFA